MSEEEVITGAYTVTSSSSAALNATEFMDCPMLSADESCECDFSPAIDYFDLLPDCICFLSAEGQLLDANKVFKKSIYNIGRSRQTLSLVNDFLYIDHRKRFIEALNKAKSCEFSVSVGACMTLCCGSTSKLSLAHAISFICSTHHCPHKLFLSPSHFYCSLLISSIRVCFHLSFQRQHQIFYLRIGIWCQ